MLSTHTREPVAPARCQHRGGSPKCYSPVECDGIGSAAVVSGSVHRERLACGHAAINFEVVLVVKQDTRAHVEAFAPRKPVDTGLHRTKAQRPLITDTFGYSTQAVAEEISGRAQIEGAAEGRRCSDAEAERAGKRSYAVFCEEPRPGCSVRRALIS